MALPPTCPFALTCASFRRKLHINISKVIDNVKNEYANISGFQTYFGIFLLLLLLLLVLVSVFF